MEAWFYKFKHASVLLLYVTVCKACIGCVQMAQLTELRTKLKIILEVGDLHLLAIRRKQIFTAMFVAMFLSIPIIITGEVQVDKAFEPTNSVQDVHDQYYKGLKTFGILSGTYFMLLSIAMLFMFYDIFKLIDGGHKLSDSLQGQKAGLKLMMLLVLISYLLASLINFFYGEYRDFGMNWFARWLCYPIVAIIIELPNMLVIYVIHW